ncbi:poly-beta-1,6-N-acetyl-D-glucosamine N-deacetylase PgaB [Lysobacter xanthus]
MPRPAEALVVLGWHDVRDRIADGNPDVGTISTRNLAMQLDWLRAHGYVPVTAQAVRDARAGRGALPDKAVLLTFDGGYRSVYTHAYPLLRAFNYPALVAVPTARIDLPAGTTVREAGRDLGSSDFLGWADVKAMQASGLVEFASQGHDLANPIAATPQGDLLPATSRGWNGGYESEAQLRERLRRDLATSADLIQRATGRRPQAVVWPTGAGGGIARSIAESLGMPLVLDAGGRTGTGDVRFAGRTRLDDDAMRPMRLVANENPGAGDLAYELRRDVRLDGMRAVRVALDDVVGSDAATTSHNVEALVERIRSIRPTHVFLQALSDTNGDGRADAAYFPGRLPVRSDLFAHVVARLASRAGVETFAWLPAGDAAASSADAIGDLAMSAPISGLVFAGDAATAGVSTDALEARARQWRPGLVTVRAVSANAGDGAALAQALPSLSANHDFVAVMLPHDDRGSRGVVDRIVADVARTPDGLDRTVFVIDAGDGTRTLAASELEAQARRVIASGGRHVAYTQDQPLKDQPPLDPARAAISARAFPYLER